MDIVGLLNAIVIWAPGILFAVTLHEWAHGYAAHRFGDPTPYMEGRLTLNPIAHIDLFMTILLPLMMLATSSLAGNPMVFGGAKPVPINPRNFPRKLFRPAMLIVAAAGPLMNLLLAIGCALLLRGVVLYQGMEFLVKMLLAAIQMNVMLMVFNLFPLPPLDGGRILTVLLPPPLDRHFAKLERLGMLILLALVFSGVLGQVLWPLKKAVFAFVMQFAGVRL